MGDLWVPAVHLPGCKYQKLALFQKPRYSKLMRTLFFVNSGQKNPKKIKRAKLGPNFEKLGQESCLSLGLLKFPSTQLPYSTQNLSSFTSEKKEPSNKITMATNGGFFVSSPLLFPILGFSPRMPRFPGRKKSGLIKGVLSTMILLW